MEKEVQNLPSEKLTGKRNRSNSLDDFSSDSPLKIEKLEEKIEDKNEENEKEVVQQQDKRRKILICCSGSVACVKIPLIYSHLILFTEVKIVATKAALHFIDKDFISKLPSDVLFTDQDEWKKFKKLGDPVLHIDLRKWADMMLLVPLSANTLAKIANGLCDNLLTSVVRAWDWTNKLAIVAPSMNTMMWEHPLTEKQIDIIKNFTKNSQSFVYLSPVRKLLACNEYGFGAMAEVETIVKAVRDSLPSPLLNSL